MTGPRVELDEVQTADYHDIARHFSVLGFWDIGLPDKVDDAYYLKFNVFDDNLVGLVPVLRTYSADDDFVLSQVLSHQFPPIMGLSALVSPTGDPLSQNEEVIVLASFRQAVYFPSQGFD